MAVDLVPEEEPTTPSPQSGMRRVFRKETPWSHRLGAAVEQVRSQRVLLLVVTLVCVGMLLLVGYALGGGFDDPTAQTGDQFITSEQAAEMRSREGELRDTAGRLAVAEGEAAFLRDEAEAAATEIDELQSALNAARVEMSVLVGIYEECMGRLYPADCIAEVRPRAEAFLTELFGTRP